MEPVIPFNGTHYSNNRAVCKSTCELVLMYPTAAPIVTVQNNMNIETDRRPNPAIRFGDVDYSQTSAYIVSPSIHLFEKQQTVAPLSQSKGITKRMPAELVITHRARGGRPLGLPPRHKVHVGDDAARVA